MQLRSQQAEGCEVLVMGSVFVELVPAPEGRPLADMEGLIPTAGGAAANFAQALASLGVRVGMLSCVGKDDLGEWLRGQLERDGIGARVVLAAGEQLTPVSFAWADQRGGKGFVFYRFPGHSDPLATLSPTDLPLEAIRAAKIFDFTEAVVRTPGVRAAALGAAECARQAGSKVVYAVNYRPQAWSGAREEIRAVQRQAIGQADMALMNEAEYRLIFPEGHPEESPERVLVVTAGERGGWLYQGGRREEFSAYPVEVRYDVGAGDSFHAGFLAAHLEGRSPGEAAQFGAACAALRVSRAASSPPPTRRETEAFMRQAAT